MCETTASHGRVYGPRIDPASIEADEDVEVREFVPASTFIWLRGWGHRPGRAHDHDGARGRSAPTSLLLLYFPLANHFEQQRHLRHQLERYGAGRCLEYSSMDPEGIAEAPTEELSRPVDSLPNPPE